MARRKIGVIGGGFVGSTTAQRIAEKELGDVVLFDIVEGMPQGKALDLAQAAPVCGYETGVYGTNDYADLAGAELVVITAGMPRKPGMDRSDLLKVNGEIQQKVVSGIMEVAPDATLVVVSNPLDVMCYVAHQVSGLPSNKVVGMAGVLDTARYRAFIAMELGCSPKDIQAMVLGGHGDSMVPLTSTASVSGIPVQQLIAPDRLQELVDRTRHGGAEIVKLLKTGSAYYAPSAAAVAMAESILLDQKRVLPSCALLNGEYGIDNTWVGVPVVLGANGVEKILEAELSAADREALHSSASAVYEGQQEIAGMLSLA
ncbi:MAG: malate dehydrogenase [Planctomycetia bacterium TMED53]|nr:MAG: malate dehydrogenase [Planctomycetia bacterium TMED53]